MGGNLNFKFRIVIWNIFFWRFEKRIALSEKKPPLEAYCFNIYILCVEGCHSDVCEALIRSDSLRLISEGHLAQIWDSSCCNCSSEMTFFFVHFIHFDEIANQEFMKILYD